MNALLLAKLENVWQPGTIRLDRLQHHEQKSESWLNLRKLTIGSSEAASVFPGISKTFKPADLRRKLRGEPRKDPGDYAREIFEIGELMEPILRDELSALLGCYIAETGIFVDEEAGMSASLDGYAVRYVPGSREPQLLLTEFKFRVDPGAGWGEGRRSLGLTVWCQVQHQMEVAGVGAALVYSGAVCGERRLWLVTKVDDTYFRMWHSWLEVRKKHARLENPPRAPAGSRDAVEKELSRLLRSTSTLVALKSPPDQQPETLAVKHRRPKEPRTRLGR